MGSCSGSSTDHQGLRNAATPRWLEGTWSPSHQLVELSSSKSNWILIAGCSSSDICLVGLIYARSRSKGTGLGPPVVLDLQPGRGNLRIILRAAEKGFQVVLWWTCTCVSAKKQIVLDHEGILSSHSSSILSLEARNISNPLVGARVLVWILCTCMGRHACQTFLCGHQLCWPATHMQGSG